MDREKIIKVTGIKPIYKRHNKPFHMSPIEENGTMVYGMEAFPKEFETFSEDEKEFSKRELMMLKDGETLNLKNNKHFAKYARALMYPSVAIERSQVNLDKHDIYLNDVYREAGKEVEKIDKTYKALDYIATKLTPKMERSLYLYLGKTNYENSTEIIRKNQLKKSCMETPDKIINFFENESSIRYEVLTRQLVYDGIIAEQSNGYFYKGSLVGTSIAGVIDRIAKDRNLRESLLAASSEGSKEQPKNVEEKAKIRENREEFLKKKVEYLELSGGKAYTGKETIPDIENAIDELQLENQNKSAKNRIENAKKEFREKYGNKELPKLRQTAVGKKYPKKEWEGFESADDMYEYLFNKEFTK